MEGRVEPGFEAVGEAFAAAFRDHGEVGAAVCVYQRARAVVDLWGGSFGPDSVTVVFSATKGMAAVCANRLVERGLLELDAPVTAYWPEFAQAGKGSLPVRWLLSHRAGLVAYDRPLARDAVLQWDPVIEALAEQRPYWPPGSAHGYHNVTFGFLVGEVVRRITGRTIGELFALEVADPLSLCAWIGMPADAPAPYVAVDDQHVRDPGPPSSGLIDRARSLNGVLPLDGAYNDPAVRHAELPATGGIANARSLARMYAALSEEVDGVRLLERRTLDAARRVESSGDDILVGPTGPSALPFSAFGLGFSLRSQIAPFGAGALGAAGRGGSLGFADPDAKIGFGYVTTTMRPGLPTADPRVRGLVRAAYESVA